MLIITPTIMSLPPRGAWIEIGRGCCGGLRRHVAPPAGSVDLKFALDLECTPSAKLKITSMRKEVFKLVFSDTIRDAGFVAELLRTDPEFVERFGSFCF